MAIKSFLKAVVQGNLSPQQPLPSISPAQFTTKVHTGASWDNIHYGERQDSDHVINEGGSGQV